MRVILINAEEYVSAMIDLKKFLKTQRFKSMILYQMIKFVWLTEKNMLLKNCHLHYLLECQFFLLRSQSASFSTYLQHIQQCFCKNFFFQFWVKGMFFFFIDLPGIFFLFVCSPHHFSNGPSLSIPVLHPIFSPGQLSRRLWNRDRPCFNFYRVKFEICGDVETRTLQLRTSSDCF